MSDYEIYNRISRFSNNQLGDKTLYPESYILEPSTDTIRDAPFKRRKIRAYSKVCKDDIRMTKFNERKSREAKINGDEFFRGE